MPPTHTALAVSIAVLAAVSVLTACGGSGDSADAALSIDAPPAADATPDADLTPDAFAVDCAQQPQLPVAFTTLEGFTDSEDFAFDAGGNLVSTDGSGNLTKQPKSGPREVFVPGLGFTAGTRYLPNGDLVIASVDTGSVLRVTPQGGTFTVLSGIAYPNGVEVDRDGFIYVAEHDAGIVRRIDPETGMFQTIAAGLFNPNGLSFSPDYNTLYVGSFGGGTIHAITRTGETTWAAPELFANVISSEDGLDGLTVDACGYVYTTVFVAGEVWRFPPDGSEQQLVAELPSFWIPNLHWGVGVGGWEQDMLYVIERDRGRVFELSLGIPEKPRVYP